MILILSTMVNCETDKDIILDKPTDTIKIAQFIATYGALYVIKLVISGVDPFWGASMIALLTAILEGKRSREKHAKYYSNNTTPVYIELVGIEIYNTRYIDNIIIPWRFYTTDVHHVIPQFIVEWYKIVEDALIKTTHKYYE